MNFKKHKTVLALMQLNGKGRKTSNLTIVGAECCRSFSFENFSTTLLE
jgi:hypothetical protein